MGKASKILTLWQPLPSVQRSWNFNSPNDVCHFQVTHFSSFLSLYLYKTSIGLVNTKTALWFMLDKLIRSIDFRQRSWLKCLDNQDPATILGPPGGHFGFLRLSLKILLNQKLIEDKLIRGSNYLGLDLPENNWSNSFCSFNPRHLDHMANNLWNSLSVISPIFRPGVLPLISYDSTVPTIRHPWSDSPALL